MGGADTSAEIEIIRRVKISEDEVLHDELLEGIPNEVTLIGIAAKLPYRAWQIARSLSPDWQRAFEGGLVYDARVRSRATQTFVAVLCSFFKLYRQGVLGKRRLSLFSPNEERWYKLPPIPGWPAGMPVNRYSKFAALDSSIYVLGGSRSREDFPTAEVFVLDLAILPLGWRRCANMQVRRRNFSVGVLYGKIFVFGGFLNIDRLEENDLQICSNEAYDPKLDAWSWIAPVKPPGDNYHVVLKTWTVGQHFVCAILRAKKSVWGSEKWLAHDYTPSSPAGEMLFVQAGARGPFLLRLSPNHRFAVDQMDGLHELVDNQRFDKVGRLPLTPDKFPSVMETPAGRLADCFRFEERITYRSRLWTYNPLKDDWEMYENRNVDPNTVDSWDLPKYMRELPLPAGDRFSYVDTEVWTMSF